MENQKIILDISSIKKCKKESIITIFEKVNVAIRHGIYKLKKKIVHTVIGVDLQNKDDEKEKLKMGMIQTASKLKSSISFIIYSTLLHQINIAVENKYRSITWK